MARTDPQFNVRMPAEVKQKLTALATENHRSINAEIIAAIQHWIEAHDKTNTDAVSIKLVAERIKELEYMVDALASGTVFIDDEPCRNLTTSNDSTPDSDVCNASNKTK